MIFYFPVRQRLYNPDIGSYAAFGIRAVQLHAPSAPTTAFVPDITLSAAEAVRLAARCTRWQLSPEQLADVAEDFLCE